MHALTRRVLSVPPSPPFLPPSCPPTSDKKAILQETMDRLLQQRQKLAEDLKPLQARKEKVG